MLGCLESSRAYYWPKWPKTARNWPPELYYQPIEYSCGLKTFSSDYNWVYNWVVCKIISPGVLGCLESIRSYNLPKMARNDQKLILNLYYWAIEYSDGLKTFPNSYEWVYTVESSKPKYYSSCLESIRSYSWPKMAQNDQKLTPDLYY